MKHELTVCCLNSRMNSQFSSHNTVFCYWTILECLLFLLKNSKTVYIMCDVVKLWPLYGASYLQFLNECLRDQNAGRSYIMKTDNSSIERVEEFKYLGTTLIYKNSIQEEINSRLKLGNACYYSVQNPLSSSLLSKNIKI